MSHDLVFTLVAHITILLTTVTGFVYSWLREGRRHRWQIEEFRQMRAEIKNGHGDPS